MKIGFDVSQTAAEKAGCGFVADQFIQALVKIDQKNEYILYPTFYSCCNPLFYNSTIPVSKNCIRHFEKMSFKDMARGWETEMEDRTHWLGSPNIIHSNNFSCIKDHSAKIVYFLHDVTPLVCPQFHAEENRLVCFDGLFSASIYADHCVSSTENTKRDFLHFFPHYPEDRMTVIPLGIRSGIRHIEDLSHKRKVLKKFNIKGEFWLGVGTIEPRKNFNSLIKAYAQLKDEKFLILAGGKGWLEPEITNISKQLGIDSKVKFLGYVSDEELSVLYSSCFAFVYPSFYEGFGLPVLEAMACGAAVITSNSSSLPEVGGEAVLYIDPGSTEDIKEKMLFLTKNTKKRKKYKTKAIKQAKKFSWDKAAKILLDVYEKTLKNKPFFSGN